MRTIVRAIGNYSLYLRAESRLIIHVPGNESDSNRLPALWCFLYYTYISMNEEKVAIAMRGTTSITERTSTAHLLLLVQYNSCLRVQSDTDITLYINILFAVPAHLARAHSSSKLYVNVLISQHPCMIK